MDPARKIEIEAESARQLLYAIAETVADDEQAVTDAIEGETNLFEAVDKALARMAELDAHRIGLEAYVANCKSRIERFDRAETRLREALQSAMQITGQKKIERALATISLRPTRPSVMVLDMTSIPVWFKRHGEWSADKTAIGAALKSGVPVPGAALSPTSTTLHVATR